MLAILIAGFTLGFAGSLHCVGMCGPLSMALPTSHLPAVSKIIVLFIYQIGRIITYSLLGLLFGLAGRGLYLSGIQQWFSITLGIVVLFIAVIYFMYERNFHLHFLNSVYIGTTRMISKILKNNTGITGFLLLGIANGLLPCGMVYIALAATLSFYKVYEGIGFMAMFGAGTLPAMMLAGFGAHLFRPSVKKVFRKAIPYFITLTGVLLILRGLNLGIAFISPALPKAAGQVIFCHQ